MASYPARMTLTTGILFSCLFQATVTSPASQDMFDISFEELMAVEVQIATGRPHPLVSAPAVATVITAENIKSMGATDLDEVLETVPGLHVERNSFYAPLYVIRGVGAGNFNPQVLLMTTTRKACKRHTSCSPSKIATSK